MKEKDLNELVQAGDIVLFRKTFVPHYCRGKYAAMLSKNSYGNITLKVIGERAQILGACARELENFVIRNGKRIEL